VGDSPQELLHGGRWSDRGGLRCGVHEAAAHVVGDAGEVRTVGREPEDAPAWTEVDRIGLSMVRCPAAVEHDDAWSGRWSGAGFGWSQVLSRGEPDLAARGGAVLGGQGQLLRRLMRRGVEALRRWHPVPEAARRGAHNKGVTASRAHRKTENGEQGNEEGKNFLASSRAGAEDIGERERVVHVEATPHGRHVDVARRHGRAW
jgi:hypothetical protein